MADPKTDDTALAELAPLAGVSPSFTLLDRTVAENKKLRLKIRNQRRNLRSLQRLWDSHLSGAHIGWLKGRLDEMRRPKRRWWHRG